MGEKFIAIGLMSGTSLDGLDIAACEFFEDRGLWHFSILEAVTLPYDAEWKDRLGHMHRVSASEFWRTHIDYGHFLGIKVREFIDSTGIKPNLVSSHGHTIFHQPGNGFTMQAGAGEAIAAETGLPVVSDFRAADLALGGQGAPLVPIGDKLLFGHYGACINIGGFTNISYDWKGIRIAFDVCPSNIVLNRLATEFGRPFDPDGSIAASGSLSNELFKDLNSPAYYSGSPPKSLGREWLEDVFIPIVQRHAVSNADKMHTICHHIAYQIAKDTDMLPRTKILVTGGGARNRFLIETIRKHLSHEMIIPEQLIIDYKEALVFAFLGVLRKLGRINVLASVTGSRMDHSAGSLFDLHSS